MTQGKRPGWGHRIALTIACFLAAHLPTLAIYPERSPQPVQARPSQLRGENGLVRAYDFILEARFDQVEAELRHACDASAGSDETSSSATAPPEACNVLEATALWWRIQLDPENRDLDSAFNASVERAIRTSEAWTDRSPEDAEAWFYLGGAYAARVQWRVLRNEKVSAARDGKRIKQALEQALELDPGLDDAYFGIGMYKYYADVAPTAAKILRFLLWLPGGDREEGLAEMLRARSRGRLLQGEADYQLHLIYLWYEEQPARALELLRNLEDRYPGNPLFPAQIAHVQDVYLHDSIASLGTWRRLLAATREQRVNMGALAEVQARLGMARMLEEICQTDHAIEQLEAIVDLEPQAPYSALAVAWLRLGEAHDRMGARAAASAAYRSASATAPSDDPFDVRDDAAERLRRRPDRRKAHAYRLSLEGWRRLEQNDLVAATAALERSLELDPDDPVARYRYGRVLQARNADDLALAQFDLTVRNARNCPPPILGHAHLESGRLHERAGRRDDAINAYRTAATLFGAASDTRSAAQRALDRIAR
jgi:predicted negative regulator of RcsB-dependent stress response